MRITVILGFTVCLTNAFPLGFPNGQQMQFHFTNDGYLNSDRLIKLGPENYRIVSENEKLKLKRARLILLMSLIKYLLKAQLNKV